MRSVALQEQLKNLWTVADLADRFQVTGMAIHQWRANRGLPAVVIPGAQRATIRFVPEEVLQWAWRNNVSIKGELQQ